MVSPYKALDYKGLFSRRPMPLSARPAHDGTHLATYTNPSMDEAVSAYHAGRKRHNACSRRGAKPTALSRLIEYMRDL
jgi:hypothetical protein